MFKKPNYLDPRQQAYRFSISEPRPSLKYLLPSFEKDFQYERGDDFIPILYPDIHGSTTYIDYQQGNFTLIIAPPGSGKTFFTRGFIGELINSNYVIADMSSIKNNFYWSRYPIQKEFQHLLPPWRKPHPLPVVPVIPSYLSQRKSIPNGMEKIQLKISDIKVMDFIKSILGCTEYDAPGQLIRAVWRDSSPPASIDILLMKVSMVNKNFTGEGQVPLFQNQTISAVMRHLRILQQEGIFGEETTVNPVEILANNQMFSLNFNGMRKPEEFHTVYMATLMRKIYEDKTNPRPRIKRRVVFVFDDMGTLACPNRSNPASKDIIINDLISLGREHGIYIIGTTQNLSQLPQEIIPQVKHFIFFGTISGNDLDVISKTRHMPRKRLENILMDKKYMPMQFPDGRRRVMMWSMGEGPIYGKLYAGFVPAPSSAHHTQE